MVDQFLSTALQGPHSPSTCTGHSQLRTPGQYSNSQSSTIFRHTLPWNAIGFLQTFFKSTFSYTHLNFTINVLSWNTSRPQAVSFVIPYSNQVWESHVAISQRSCVVLYLESYRQILDEAGPIAHAHYRAEKKEKYWFLPIYISFCKALVFHPTISFLAAQLHTPFCIKHMYKLAARIK